MSFSQLRADRFGSLLACVVLSFLVGTLTLSAVVIDETSVHPSKTASHGATVTRTIRVLEADSWRESFSGGRLNAIVHGRPTKRSRRAARRSSPNFSGRTRLGRLTPGTDRLGPRGLQRSPKRRIGPTYRTVCVRLCDGYYFPISTSTTRGRFRRDARKCASSCNAPTRLFYHPAASTAADMVDLRGRKYAKLKTAFLYRTSYEPSCQCRARPDSQEAKIRHKVYALQAERKKKWNNRTRRRAINREIAEHRRDLRKAQIARKRAAKTATATVMASVTDEALSERVDKFVVQPTVRENALTFDERRSLVPDDASDAEVETAPEPSEGAQSAAALGHRARRARRAEGRRASSRSRRRSAARSSRMRPKMRVGLRRSIRPKRSSRRPRVARKSQRRARRAWRRNAFSSSN
ncbi:MAG: DUF2865 domain-containing protein [Pseudomonadota bacterium]